MPAFADAQTGGQQSRQLRPVKVCAYRGISDRQAKETGKPQCLNIRALGFQRPPHDLGTHINAENGLQFRLRRGGQRLLRQYL